ncbi:MAG TPA: four helix bundle protein [Salinimicrobium sp.]|nr:four helix bundle protein [Salinimicrobium sp.]
MRNNYKNLDIYQISLKLFFETHKISLSLPKYELYELGSQVRRSADSVFTNIVEGYGRRRYKADFIRFLIYSHSSNDETICHLEKLMVLYPDLLKEHQEIKNEYENLGAKINSFIRYVETSWKS